MSFLSIAKPYNYFVPNDEKPNLEIRCINFLWITEPIYFDSIPSSSWVGRSRWVDSGPTGIHLWDFRTGQGKSQLQAGLGFDLGENQQNFQWKSQKLEIFILGFCWLCLAWCSCCRGVLPPPRLEILELLLGHLHSCLAFQFEIEASLLVNSSEKTNQPSRTLTNLLKIVGSPVRNYCV